MPQNKIYMKNMIGEVGAAGVSHRQFRCKYRTDDDVWVYLNHLKIWFWKLFGS